MKLLGKKGLTAFQNNREINKLEKNKKEYEQDFKNKVS